MASGSGCNWQKVACAVALRGHFSVITGGPGTGKTYTAARLLALLFATAAQPEQLRVALAAPTGKAAARLKESIETALKDLQQVVGDALDLEALVQRVGAARTLHSLLGARPDTRHWGFHAGRPLDVDVLIVDEASMVHLEMMSALLDALPPHARLVLLGTRTSWHLSRPALCWAICAVMRKWGAMTQQRWTMWPVWRVSTFLHHFTQMPWRLHWRSRP